MKKTVATTLFTAIILLISPALKGQISETAKKKVLRHEIGINLFSSLSNTSHISLSQYDGYNKNYVNGLYYKYHLSPKSTLRFYTSIRSYEEKSNNYYKNEISYFEHSYQAGYERALNTGKLQFFGSMNLHLRQGKEVTSGVFGSDAPYVDYKRHTSTFGISPALGLKYAITNRITVLVESSLEFSLELEKTRGNYYGGMWGSEGTMDRRLYNKYVRENPINSFGISYKI